MAQQAKPTGGAVEGVKDDPSRNESSSPGKPPALCHVASDAACQGKAFDANKRNHDLPDSPRFALGLVGSATRTEMQCAARSLRAATMIKPNQDSFTAVVDLECAVPFGLFSVCDGHGDNGHVASQIVIEMLRSTTNQCKGIQTQQELTETVVANIAKAEDILGRDPRLRMELSGTTCCTVIVTSTQVVCINIGDSRAVEGRHDLAGGMRVMPLSWDQTAEVQREIDRIESEVAASDRPQSQLLTIGPLLNKRGEACGPSRVWIPSDDGHTAGLAMSRSVGDCVGKSAGLSAEPEIECFDIDPCTNQVLVVASDGVWDMMSNEEALEICLRNNSSPYAAANALRTFCIRRWHEEEGMVVDDVTVLVIFLRKIPAVA